MTKKTNDGGFTLIELIVVMGIILFLCGISFGVILTIVRDEALISKAQEIKNVVREFSSKARSQKRPYRIIFDFGRGSMRIFSSGLDGKFGSFEDQKAGEDDVLERELLLPRSMYFERAITPPPNDEEGNPRRQPKKVGDPLPDPNENDEVGALLLHGERYIEIQRIIPLNNTIVQTGTDEMLDVPTTDWEACTNADIIIGKYGSHKKILIDIMQASAQIKVKIAKLKVEEVEEEEEEEEE